MDFHCSFFQNGVIYGTQYAIEYMEEKGVVVNIASVAGRSSLHIAPWTIEETSAVTECPIIGL